MCIIHIQHFNIYYIYTYIIYMYVGMKALRYILFQTNVTGFVLVFSFSIFVTLSLTKPEPPVHKWGWPHHCAQDLISHIWLPFNDNALLIPSGLWHLALGHHGILYSPHSSHKHIHTTPCPAPPNGFRTKLLRNGREEKRRIEKEKGELGLPLFLKNKKLHGI